MKSTAACWVGHGGAPLAKGTQTKRKAGTSVSWIASRKQSNTSSPTGSDRMKRSVVYAQIFKTLCLVKSAASPPRCSVFLPVGMSLETKVAELPIREHDVGSEKAGIRFA